MMYPIIVLNESKDSLVMHLENSKIETRDMLPLLSQPIYKEIFGDIISQYPVAEKIENSGFYVGIHQFLTKMEIHFIADKIHEYFKK